MVTILPSFQYTSAVLRKFLSQIRAYAASTSYSGAAHGTLPSGSHRDVLTISVGSIISCLLLSSYCSGPFHFFFVLHTRPSRNIC